MRLGFADWLQERGEDERAEFIRLACECARKRWSACRTGEDLSAIGYRAGDLLTRHHGEWFPYVGWTLCGDWEIAGNLENGMPWAYIGRGFVESARCAADEWFRDGDVIRAGQPVRLVELTRFAWGTYRRRDGREVVVPDAATARAFLGEYWEGVEFELPGVRHPASYGGTRR